MDKTCLSCKYFYIETTIHYEGNDDPIDTFETGCRLGNNWEITESIETSDFIEKMKTAQTCGEFEDIESNLNRTIFR